MQMADPVIIALISTIVLQIATISLQLIKHVQKSSCCRGGVEVEFQRIDEKN